jgi:hypothetical protein
MVAKRKIIFLEENKTALFLPVWSHWTDWAIPATFINPFVCVILNSVYTDYTACRCWNMYTVTDGGKKKDILHFGPFIFLRWV